MIPSGETGSTVCARPAPGTTLAGYRLVRQLDGDAATWLARAEGMPSRVLTLCREDDSVRRRVAAHERVRSPHVLAVLDVATDAAGSILLIFERTDWSVATLLASRAAVAAGEAVTVLAPIAAGLAAIHGAGLVHGRLSAATVHFTADGRPVIGGLEGASDDPIRVSAADGWMRWTPGARADFRAVSGLIRAVAAAVDGRARPGFADVADWLDTVLDDPSADPSLLAQLECRIFAVAPALPLVLVADRPAADAATSVPSRSRQAPGKGVLQDATARVDAARRLAVRLAHVGVGAWLRRVARGHTLAVCLGVGVLVLALGAGLAAVPGRVDAGDAPGTTGTPTAPAPRSSAHDTGDPGLALTAEEKAQVDGEDPAGAVAALLALRARCATAGAADCAAEFAEPGSALDEADRHQFSTGAAGMLLVDPGSRSRVEVVQAYGDAVLTRVVPADDKRQPVLVLVVRTDTGWRLRDAFEPD